MSLTRLAGAWSSDGFLAKRTVPSGASRRADSALRCSGRSAWAHAGAAIMRAAEEITTRKRTGNDCTGGGRPVLEKMLPDGALELRRGLEPWRASARHVHGLAGPGIFPLARLSTADGERAEADQRHRLSALERGADRGEERAQRPVRGGLGPAALGRHRRDEIRASHERRITIAIRSGRMLAEAVWAVKGGRAARGRAVVWLIRCEEGAPVLHGGQCRRRGRAGVFPVAWRRGGRARRGTRPRGERRGLPPRGAARRAHDRDRRARLPGLRRAPRRDRIAGAGVGLCYTRRA